MRNSPTADQNTLYRIRYINGQKSSPTSQIIVHHIMRATRVCRPPHPNGILSSTIQTEWPLFSINTTLTAINMHLISQFACKQSTFQSVKGHNRRIKSRSGDGSRHLGMWWTIVLHISCSTVNIFGVYFKHVCDKNVHTNTQSLSSSIFAHKKLRQQGFITYPFPNFNGLHRWSLGMA